MALDRIFDIASSAISAQGKRLNVVASNLANADSVAGPDGEAYKARQAVFQAITQGKEPGGVRLVDIVEDPSPGKDRKSVV